MASETLTIDVVSDVVCPWCYLGEKRLQAALADRVLDTFAVEQGHVGVLFEDGSYIETLPPGKYAFWKNMAKVMLVPVDLRETMLDIGGQEIMTADKVTLRLNAVATYRVADMRACAALLRQKL